MSARRGLMRAVTVATVVVLVVIVGLTTRERWRRWFTSEPSSAAITALPAAPPASVPSDDARGPVALDLRRRQLIGVKTAAVTRGAVDASIGLLGVVQADETRLMDVNVKVEGWVRDLRADFTGQPVTQGQVLLSIYSPDLQTAEREYVLALANRDDLRGSVSADARDRSEALVAASRRRLELWDVPSDDVTRLEQTREPATTVPVRSPIDGFVLDKPVVSGMHVTPGQTLYRLANLDDVWLEAEAYEHDLPVLRVGSTARLTIDAYPDESFNGRIVFVAPSLDPATRTAKVRFQVSNRNRRLKPGMYAHVDLPTSRGTALVVPSDAVIDSGREQLVFVADDHGTFTPTRVTVGARGRDNVEIASGLREGQRVATGAAFFLDSESQLRAGADAYAAPPGSAPGSPAAASDLSISLATEPNPAATGTTTFVVSIKDASGQPVSDAVASIQLFLPAMPTMNMPAMRSHASLAGTGAGTYRGSADLAVAGRWDTTVTVSRAGQPAGSLQTTLVVR